MFWYAGTMTQPVQMTIKISEQIAPSIDGDYPSSPDLRAAWSAAWTILTQAPGDVRGTALIQVVHALVPAVTAKTVRGLLDKAHREGLLYRDQVGKHVVYEIHGRNR